MNKEADMYFFKRECILNIFFKSQAKPMEDVVSLVTSTAVVAMDSLNMGMVGHS